MAEKFEKGQKVKMNSGGPIMTVRWCEDEYGEMTAFCEWFDSKNELKSGKFAATSLVEAE